jgi:hypothetical protein
MYTNTLYEVCTTKPDQEDQKDLWAKYIAGAPPNAEMLIELTLHHSPETGIILAQPSLNIKT